MQIRSNNGWTNCTRFFIEKGEDVELPLQDFFFKINLTNPMTIERAHVMMKSLQDLTDSISNINKVHINKGGNTNNLDWTATPTQQFEFRFG